MEKGAPSGPPLKLKRKVVRAGVRHGGLREITSYITLQAKSYSIQPCTARLGAPSLSK